MNIVALAGRLSRDPDTHRNGDSVNTRFSIAVGRKYKDENGEYTDCSVFAAEEMLEFIHNEPDLAFCRAYCGWDYNREYHTREEATTSEY